MLYLCDNLLLAYFCVNKASFKKKSTQTFIVVEELGSCVHISTNRNAEWVGLRKLSNERVAFETRGRNMKEVAI